LYRLGVPVTLNSDDPTIQDTDLSDDYEKAEKHFAFTVDDFINLNLTALQCSFVTDSEKKSFQSEYLRTVGDFKKTLSPRKLTLI
jgi:adenosine deaminase